MTTAPQPRLSILRHHPTAPPIVWSRLSVQSTTSTGAPVSFSLLREPSSLPVAGLVISEATTYLYTAQHLLRESRPGRASDYLKSSLGLFATLVATSRINDVIIAGIAEAHLYLAKAAHVIIPTPGMPDDPQSHLKRAQLALVEVGDGVDVQKLKEDVEKFKLKLKEDQVRKGNQKRRRINTNRGDAKEPKEITSFVEEGEKDDDDDDENIKNIRSPLEELSPSGRNNNCNSKDEKFHQNEGGCYNYFKRCALPNDLHRHPALTFGRQRRALRTGGIDRHKRHDDSFSINHSFKDSSFEKKSIRGLARKTWFAILHGFYNMKNFGASADQSLNYIFVRDLESKNTDDSAVYVCKSPNDNSGRRFSLSQILRRKALSPDVEKSDDTTIYNEIEDSSMAKAKLRRNPTNPVLYSPIPRKTLGVSKQTKVSNK